MRYIADPKTRQLKFERSDKMVYNIDAIILWLRGRISWRSLRLVLRTRQEAVCGRGGAYIICRETQRDFGGR
jgi:hypothetical protein